MQIKPASPSKLREQFFQQGFVGPFELETDRDWSEVRDHISRVLRSEGPWDDDDMPSKMLENHPHGASQIDRHLDCELVHDLLTDPAITERLASLYGEDMLLLFSEFMIKEPKNEAGTIPWHQDGGYFGLHPSVSPSVWLAVSEVTEENGALEFYPECASQRVPHQKTDGEDQWFEYEIDTESTATFGSKDTVTLEMEPGEFILFHNAAIHRSSPNLSDERRIALQTRSTVPYARINSAKRPEQPMVVHHGENDYGVHDDREPPSDCQH